MKHASHTSDASKTHATSSEHVGKHAKAKDPVLADDNTDITIEADDKPTLPDTPKDISKDEIEIDTQTAYPYGAESMLELNSGTTPTTSHQQFKENPRVIYPNTDSLSRPLTVPDSARGGIVALVVVAIIIACALLWVYFDATENEPKREQEQLQAQLDKDTSLDLPNLLSFLDMDDVEIANSIKESGHAIIEQKSAEAGDGYKAIKLPSDVSVVDAEPAYVVGLNKLTASEAVSYLNGSWSIDVDRKNGLNLSVHYADFSSGTLEAAITNAIQSEDLERGGIVDSGEDDGYGNAYSTGSIMVSGETYTWTVSAIPLVQVYSLSGMPDSACYVGIRIKSTS